ncbi:MAG: DUF349 domain-containing protein [Flavobacteriales bacterium]
MDELNDWINQMASFETAEDLISLGKALSELKRNFEDSVLALEREQQIKLLESREQGTPYETEDYTAQKSEFYSRYKILVEKRKSQLSLKDTLEKENVKLKKDLLEELKKIIAAEENIGSAFNAYQRIHETWKKIGDIPRDQRDEIQREYSRLLEIFFYTMRIYREIKDHDYKRNLQLKQKVLTQLQQLRNEAHEIKAIEQRLRTLQNEWEEVGPVPNEEWEPLKSTYWETVRQIYEKINAHYDSQRQVYAENIARKKELVAQVAQLVSDAQSTDHPKTWDRIIQSLKNIQESYKTIGPGKKQENDAVWKAFRAECDALFEIKKTYNKEQNERFADKIQRKKALIDELKGLVENAASKEATARVIQCQKQWKEIGPTGKAEPKLWSAFRASCDAFFTKKDDAYKALDIEKEENAAKKEAIIEKIQGLMLDEKSEGLALLRECSQAFKAIGPAPQSKSNDLWNRYNQALQTQYNALKLNEVEREDLLFIEKIQSIKPGPERLKLLQKERGEIRKQIDRMAQEANRMETNLAFFARSKGADTLKKEVEQKIDGLQKQIAVLTRRLKQIPHE